MHSKGQLAHHEPSQQGLRWCMRLLHSCKELTALKGPHQRTTSKASAYGKVLQQAHANVLTAHALGAPTTLSLTHITMSCFAYPAVKHQTLSS